MLLCYHEINLIHIIMSEKTNRRDFIKRSLLTLGAAVAIESTKGCSEEKKIKVYIEQKKRSLEANKKRIKDLEHANSVIEKDIEGLERELEESKKK